MPDVSDYSLRLAKKRVEEYRDQDAIMSQHQEAMACRDCEDFLEHGIEAYNWLRQADRVLRQAAVEGFGVSEEARDALAALYRVWLNPCPHAEERIKQQEERNFRLRNLHEFRAACEYVEQQVRLLDMEEEIDDAFEGRVFDEEFWKKAHDMRSA